MRRVRSAAGASPGNLGSSACGLNFIVGKEVMSSGGTDSGIPVVRRAEGRPPQPPRGWRARRVQLRSNASETTTRTTLLCNDHRLKEMSVETERSDGSGTLT